MCAPYVLSYQAIMHSHCNRCTIWSTRGQITIIIISQDMIGKSEGSGKYSIGWGVTPLGGLSNWSMKPWVSLKYGPDI